MFDITKNSTLIVVLSFIALFDMSLAASTNSLVALEAEKNQLINEIVAVWKETIVSNGLGSAKGQSQAAIAEQLANYRKILVTNFVGRYDKKDAAALQAINKRLRAKLATMKKYAMPQSTQGSVNTTTVDRRMGLWQDVKRDWSDVEDDL